MPETCLSSLPAKRCGRLWSRALAALYARIRTCHGLIEVLDGYFSFAFHHQGLPLSERLGGHFRWLDVVAQHRQSLLDAVSTFGNRLPGPVEFH